MARIALKKPAAASTSSPEKGWRSGRTNTDRTKLRAELERLEEIVLRQGSKLEGYAALYQRVLKYFAGKGLHTEAERLSAEVEKVHRNAWSKYKMKGTKS